MSVEQNKQIVSEWYEGLAAMDQEKLLACQSDDVIYNVHGKTPVSGRWLGKDVLVHDVMPQVFNALDFESFRFGKKWKIMCADANRVVGFMEAEGLANNGKRYDQRYCHVFEIRDDKIVEVWEFFDSCLAATVLFGNELVKPETEPARAFEF